MFALHPPANKLPTFTHQKSLPRLPVPPLRATLDKYLKSIEPILKEENKSDEEVAKRKTWAKEFEEGLGHRLQQRLLDVDRTSPNNWLDDTIWIKKAYHEWRAPLLINSNWWLLFQDDATIPKEFRDSLGDKEGHVSHWQIRRSAWLARRFVEFKEKVENQEIHPDSSRIGPFCMYQYTRLYNISRIPLPVCDAISAKPAPKDGRHMTVMYKDWCCAVGMYDQQGALLSSKDIEERLWTVVKDAEEREKRGEKAVPVGVLTSDDRDLWTKNREHLLTISPVNRTSLTSIENSLFCLSLDNYTLPSSVSPTPSFAPPSVNALVQNCAHGVNARNRWFDKALSVMVESNGRAAMNGEHSPCDALIPSIIVDWAVAEPIDLQQFEGVSATESEKDVSLLEWAVDETMQKELVEAEERAKKLIEDSDASQLWFDEYGAEWMKSTAKISPDAYLQMALQLAWFKDMGCYTATYETASTRLFKHGRTDVIRTLSDDSRNFVRAMVDPDVPATERYALLQKATTSHNNLTRESSLGKGIDRHLLGLRLMIRPDQGEQIPELFKDDVFSKSQEWRLSTSGLSAGDRFLGTGFGTVWPNGYGINYLAGAKLIKFGIESKHSCPVTSTVRFQQNVIESLREMRMVCEEGAESATPSAKL